MEMEILQTCFNMRMNLQVLNKTEDSLVDAMPDGAGAVIHNVFNAKRTVVNAKKDAIKASH